MLGQSYLQVLMANNTSNIIPRGNTPASPRLRSRLFALKNGQSIITQAANAVIRAMSLSRSARKHFGLRYSTQIIDNKRVKITAVPA